MEPICAIVAGSVHSGPRSLNIGVRETLSTPPATTRDTVVAANAGRALANCVDAGCAESVEGCAGDGVAPTGKECGSSSDVRALLVHLRCATENDVVDLFCA